MVRIVLFLVMFFSAAVQAEENNPDPWEGFNRSVFEFNEVLDRNVAKPLAQGYQYITPKPVDDSVTNFFSNLEDVLVIVNDVLQLKFGQALSDTGRVLINTTVGFFGFFDVASKIGLEKHNEDFGQTLGYWGVGSGPYLVLPVLGPSTLRDAFGTGAESYSSLGYTEVGTDFEEKAGVFVLRNIDLRADLIASEGLITGEKYSFLRSFYLQRREYLINDGAVEDDFDDEEDWDDEDEEDWGDDWDEESSNEDSF